MNFIVNLLVLLQTLSRPHTHVHRPCLLLLFGALLLGACTTTPPIIIPPSATENTTEAPQAWVRDFPKGLTKVRLHAYEDCLFVTGHKRQGAQSLRTQLCMDPLTGDIVWVHERPIQSDAQQVDEYLFADQHLIYANRQSITALRRSDGTQAWTFKDKDSRAIFRTSLVGDKLLLSLGNETLMMMDVATGKPQGTWSMEGRALKQAALTPQGPVAVLIQAPKDSQAQALLQGSLLQPTTPKENPLPITWQLPVSTWSYDLYTLDGVILGALEEGTLQALDATNGTVLWKSAEDALPGKMLLGQTGLYWHTPGKPPTTQNAPMTPSRLMRTLPRQAPGQGAQWTLDVPSFQDILGVEPPPKRTQSPDQVLGATLDTFFVFDRLRGTLLWTYSFNKGNEPAPWTNASCTTQAMYLYLEPQGASQSPGKLKRIPILAEQL